MNSQDVAQTFSVLNVEEVVLTIFPNGIACAKDFSIWFFSAETPRVGQENDICQYGVQSVKLLRLVERFRACQHPCLRRKAFSYLNHHLSGTLAKCPLEPAHLAQLEISWTFPLAKINHFEFSAI
jgi:hypothetical protein